MFTSNSSVDWGNMDTEGMLVIAHSCSTFVQETYRKLYAFIGPCPIGFLEYNTGNSEYTGSF